MSDSTANQNEALTALRERVIATNAPDRELDACLWLASTAGATRQNSSYVHLASGQECHIDETRDATGRLVTVPSYTASIDAAIALFDLMLPGWQWLARNDDEHGFFANLTESHFRAVYHGAYASSAPLAIIHAILTALLARGEG